MLPRNKISTTFLLIMITKRYLKFHDLHSYIFFFSSPCHTCSTMIFSFSRLLFNSLICSAEKSQQIAMSNYFCYAINEFQDLRFKYGMFIKQSASWEWLCCMASYYTVNNFISEYKEMTSTFILNHRVHKVWRV